MANIHMIGAAAIVLTIAGPAWAQDHTVTLPDLIQNAQAWAEDNLDTNVLKALPEVDDQAAQQFLQTVEARFHGDYVVDLSGLAATARVIQPLLASHEATQPYAAWLAAQMDYFEVADEIHVAIPPPNAATNQPPPAPTNPPPQMQRTLWIKKVAAHPWSAAAKEYVPQLKPIFAAQKVPVDLVWIAEVESSFDRRACSPVGAAGLFQLMPDTAREYGLSLWPRDQRLQMEPSAKASALLLKHLYERFQDWRLAVAAYNVGEGAVQKLLSRSSVRSYDGIARHLPAETQMYVPRVEAVLLAREGSKLEELPAPRM